MEIIVENPYFFTATILEWKLLLKQEKFKTIITNSLNYLVEKNESIFICDNGQSYTFNLAIVK